MNQLLKSYAAIEAWLQSMRIKNYQIIRNKDHGFVVDAIDVVLKNCPEIKVKFNEIKENFDCRSNGLVSLKGSPHTVHGDYICSFNNLVSLEFAPMNVGKGFVCIRNQLTSLEFCPQSVGKGFYCFSNKIENLDFLPVHVGMDFECDDNPSLGAYQKMNNLKDIRNQVEIKAEKNRMNQAIVIPNQTSKTLKI